jgi:hypothetical protein
VISLILRAYANRYRTGRILAKVAVLLGIVSPAGYMIGSGGDWTLAGALILGSPIVLGALGVARHGRIRPDPRGFDVVVAKEVGPKAG